MTEDDLTERLRDGSPTGELAADFLSLVLAGRRSEASQKVVDAVDQGMTVRDAYMEVFQPVQYEVGRLWMENRIGVAEEHFCTAVTQLTMSRLYPKLFGSERTGRGMVAAVIGGDLHEIGLRMVTDFFEMEGWDTYFMGADTPTEAVREAVESRDAQLVGLSVGLSEHLPELKESVAALEEIRSDRGLKIMVGGWPFIDDPDLVREVGADGWAPDAAAATAEGDRLVPSRRA